MAAVRAADLVAAAHKRGFAAGDFLTEEQQTEYEAVFRKAQKEEGFFFSFEGGAGGAERRVPVILGKEYEDFSFSDFSEIEILSFHTGSGALPDHRTVLGSLLGLGLDRSAVGDIFIFRENTAVAVKQPVVPYILSNLTKLGRDSAEVLRIDLPEHFSIERKTEELLVSVSSLRLDCLISAICHLSREDAVEYIKKGLAGVNHGQTVLPDKKIAEGSVLSLRGKGRFLFDSIAGQTKSGRIRVKILKYL